MGGGLMQLVAHGAQDVYLTGNPQITFFKVVYRRHTNFSMESIEQTLNGVVETNSKVTSTISRNGDLIYRMWLEIIVVETYGSNGANATVITSTDPPEITNNAKITQIPNIGHAILNNVEIEIGGQKIDKHYAQWMDIWNELTLPSSKNTGFSNMINVPSVSSDLDLSDDAVNKSDATTLYIPMQFWFCRNPGLALPLIALQYHEVKINIQFEDDLTLGLAAVATTHTDTTTLLVDANNHLSIGTYKAPSVTLSEAKLWVDYIYLDTDERRRFAQVSHEYLIEQVQFTGFRNSLNIGHRLNFNHPVKELIWIEQNIPAAKGTNDSATLVGMFEYLLCKDAKLQLNGHDRFTTRDSKYFTLVQPYQHHTAIPDSNIHVYSFALKPEDHQPSGTCNMSRIDDVTLTITPNNENSKICVFGLSYNVLRVMGGMAGVAYSN